MTVMNSFGENVLFNTITDRHSIFLFYVLVNNDICVWWFWNSSPNSQNGDYLNPLTDFFPPDIQFKMH